MVVPLRANNRFDIQQGIWYEPRKGLFALGTGSQRGNPRANRSIMGGACTKIRRTIWDSEQRTGRNKLRTFASRHLREKYRDQRGLAEEFIWEFEGDRKNCDVTRWDRFSDIKDIKKEMLKRCEAHFDKWLNL
jgi:hypothetical protein